MIYAGIDVGNDGVKAIFEGGEHKLFLPNCIAETSEKREYVEMESSPLDALHVRIDSPAITKPFIGLVGEIAKKNNNNSEPKHHEKKGESDQTIIMLLTSIAIDAAARRSDIYNNTIELNYILSTGLPLVEIKKEKSKESYKDRLTQETHTIKFLKTPVYEGVTVRINIKNALISSEGHAAYVNLVVRDDGTIIDKSLVDSKVMIVDVGSITTDIAILENKKLDNTMSAGYKLGVASYLDDLIRKIEDDHMLQIKSRKEMANLIINKKGKINYRGKTIDLNSTINKHMDHFALKIYEAMDDILSQLYDVEHIYMIGGGSAIVKDQLSEINRNANNYNLVFQDTAEESVWMIAKSYYKVMDLTIPKNEKRFKVVR